MTVDRPAELAALLHASLAAMRAGHDVDVTPLLPLLRSHPVAAYPGAPKDEVDVDAIVEVLHRHPKVIDAQIDAAQIDEGQIDGVQIDEGQADVHSPRGPPQRHRRARALLDAAILALEGAKLRHGLRAAPAALKRHFADVEEARRCLSVVAARETSWLAAPAAIDENDAPAEAARARAVATLLAPSHRRDGPVHVVVGPDARVILDLLAPSVRRLRVDLARLGRAHRPGGAHAPHDNDVYLGLEVLNATAPETIAERRAQDAREGVFENIAGGVVDFATLPEEQVDRRARSLLAPLRQLRASLVLLVDDDDVDAALGLTEALPSAQIASVQVVCEASLDDETTTPALLDATRTTLIPGGADQLTRSLAWPGLAPLHDDQDAPETGWDDGAFDLWQVTHRALLRRRLAIAPVLWRWRRDHRVDRAVRLLASLSPVGRLR